jgi:hypothetical protein
MGRYGVWTLNNRPDARRRRRTKQPAVGFRAIKHVSRRPAPAADPEPPTIDPVEPQPTR